VSQYIEPVDSTSLLLRARDGDASAFEALVRMYQSSVFSIGYRMLNRRDAAEDLAQDVFLQLYRRLDSIESLEHLGFWLRRVAANLAIDWLRRAAHRRHATARSRHRGSRAATG
jgi:RNA polymerase sigma-70 factor (ECF subfamily)